jgi:hypothetical protein
MNSGRSLPRRASSNCGACADYLGVGPCATKTSFLLQRLQAQQWSAYLEFIGTLSPSSRKQFTPRKNIASRVCIVLLFSLIVRLIMRLLFRIVAVATIPTVRVTDLASTRSVIVRIVDRGPWSRDRVLDLERP